MSTARKTGTFLTVLITAFVLSLLMAAASYADSNPDAGFGDDSPFSSETTIAIGESASITPGTDVIITDVKPTVESEALVDVQKQDGVYTVVGKSTGQATLRVKYEKTQDTGSTLITSLDLKVKVIHEQSPVGFGDAVPYDTEITLVEGESAAIKCDRDAISSLGYIDVSNEYAEAGIVDLDYNGEEYVVTAKKEGTVKLVGVYYATQQSSSAQQLELTVNVVKMRDYKFTFADGNLVDIDHDNFRTAVLQYLNEKGYYHLYKNVLEVPVDKVSGGWEVSIKTGKELTYKDVQGAEGILDRVYIGETKPENLVGFGRNEITSYKTKDNFDAEQNDETALPAEGAVFYALTTEMIPEAKITVDAPLCGQVFKVNNAGIPTGGQPKVTVPAGAFYSEYSFESGSSRTKISSWYTLDSEGNPGDELKNGIVLVGGRSYAAYVPVKPFFGCLFNEDAGATVNGSNALKTVLNDEEGVMEIYGKVTAKHNWNNGKVTKKPTLKATGVKTFTCKGCGKTKTSVIAKLKANTLRAKGKTVKIRYAKLKKRAQTIAKKNALTITNAKGTLTYKKVKGNKKITVNTKTGKITVKKGLKKGTYKVKIKVTAKGTTLYGAGSKTPTVTIKVVK